MGIIFVWFNSPFAIRHSELQGNLVSKYIGNPIVQTSGQIIHYI